jgi:hypothetical protein
MPLSGRGFLLPLRRRDLKNARAGPGHDRLCGASFEEFFKMLEIFFHEGLEVPGRFCCILGPLAKPEYHLLLSKKPSVYPGIEYEDILLVKHYQALDVCPEDILEKKNHIFCHFAGIPAVGVIHSDTPLIHSIPRRKPIVPAIPILSP